VFRALVWTLRQRRYAALAATGLANKEVADRLAISEATVKVHMTHILEKLRVSSRAEAINVATVRGLVRC